MQPIRRHALASRAFALVAVAVMSLGPVAPAPAAPVKPVALRVAVDPGHGGGYSGAYYSGTAEKNLNLAIAKRLVAELRRRGIDASLTRSSDTKVYTGGGLRTWRWIESANAYRYATYPAEDAGDRLTLDLQARADRANAAGADLFVSIHCNAAGSTARGIEVWRAPNDPLGQAFATDVLAGLIGRTGATNRGVHEANFYVTRWSNMPAILVESGFMSNSTELSRLRSSWYQERLADGIADGIESFSADAVAEPYDRIAGSDRWSTATQVSKRSHPSGAQAVVLASGEGFADSLVAGPLARSMDAPVLTTGAATLPPAIAAEIERLSPARLVIVGGENAVSSAVATAAAEAAGIPVEDVERLGGRTRYDVSLAVARQLESADTSAVVVTAGESWADALSISASAADRGEPIVLCPPSGLTTSQVAFIASGDSTRAVTVVGGTAVVPTSALRGLAFKRLSGYGRYDTNWEVLKARYTEAQRLSPILASGERFNDALVVGPYAATLDRPVMLVGKSTVSADARPWLYDRRSKVFSATVVGGTAAVTAYAGPSHEKWRMRSY